MFDAHVVIEKPPGGFGSFWLPSFVKDLAQAIGRSEADEFVQQAFEQVRGKPGGFKDDIGANLGLRHEPFVLEIF